MQRKRTLLPMPSRREVWRQTVRDITGAFDCSEIKELMKELETFIAEQRALEEEEPNEEEELATKLVTEETTNTRSHSSQ